MFLFFFFVKVSKHRSRVQSAVYNQDANRSKRTVISEIYVAPFLSRGVTAQTAHCTPQRLGLRTKHMDRACQVGRLRLG